MFRVWVSRTFDRDTSADKLSPRAIPCVSLGFVPDASGLQFYHPTLRHVLPSQDVTFDESVPFYGLFPYRSTPPLPPPLFLVPGPLPVDPLPPQGPAPSGVSQVDPLLGPVPVEVAVGSSAARCAVSGGAAFGGVEPGGAGSEGALTGGAELGGVGTGGAEPGGAEPEGVEPGGAASEGEESGGAEPQGAALFGGSASASPRLSLQQLREWFVRHARLQSGAIGAGGAGVAAGASGARGAAATGPGGARTWGTGAAGTGGVEGAGVVGPDAGDAESAGAGVGGTGAVDPCDGGAGGTVRPRPYFVPLLQQQRELASCPVSPVRTTRSVPRSRPPPVPGTHAMTPRPSSVPVRVSLLAPPKSSLLEVPHPESDRTCAVSPAVSRLLADAVTGPSFESATLSALVAELLDFANACRQDYATTLVTESTSASPPSVGGGCALGTDVLEDKQEDFECLAAAVPRFASMLLTPKGDPDAPDIPTPRSYVEAITGPLALMLPVLLTTAHSSVYQPLTLSSTFGQVRRAECTSGMGLVLGGRGPGWENGGGCRAVDAMKPAAPVARETVVPVARETVVLVASEPVALVARESVAPAARLAAEPVTPVARVPVAPIASVPVSPVARVPAASATTHHLLSSHGPSSSSLALSFLCCTWCTPSRSVVHKVLHYKHLG
ncbi:unnamed protein product, partial [Closterium sp. NIES-54]